MIRLVGVGKRFAGSTVAALDDVTLDIAGGEIFGVIGQSGAEKSTLIRLINALERPSTGRVEVDGIDVACGDTAKEDGRTLTIAATAVPHAEILETVKPVLAKEGVELKIRVFNDYVQPNLQVDQHQIDVSYFETKPYLDEFNRSRGTHLVTYAGIHVEPLGAYSRKWKRIADLPRGALVAIPNEPSNGGRALLLLQRAGLIRLRNPTDPLATLHDIVANPRALRFKELEGATLPRTLDEVDLALINTNYALDARLSPVRDALIIEDAHTPYVNFVVGRPGGEHDPRVVKLIAALRSPATRRFILDHCHGAVLPAF